MKTIYFVRHGESESNAGGVQLGAESALTEKGVQQAEFMAKRCLSLPLEVVIASTYKRAQDTAEIINRPPELEIESSELFVERRRPSEQIGLSKDDQKWKEIDSAIRANLDQPGWRYSDEENLEDLLDRSRQALEFLAQRPEEYILVVTHGWFMRVVMAWVVLGSKVTPETAKQFVRKFHLENTGLTVVGYDPDWQGSETPWFLWVWNDHAHLAE